MAVSITSVPGFAVPGFAAVAGVPPGNVIVRAVTVEVLFNGVPLDNVLAVRCSYGWDQPVSEAQITLDAMPTVGTYDDPIEIRTTTIVNGVQSTVLRFVGIMTDRDFSNWPRTVVLKARGDLSKAERYINQDNTEDPVGGGIGTPLDVLLGGPSSGTLKDIVEAVLTVCGVSFNPANFQTPPHVYGLVEPNVFTWKLGTSGLAYLHSLFEASAGYRLFHSGDGELYLAQIIGRPRTGAPDVTLTQGQDILDGGRITRSISKLANIVSVSGFDPGDSLGPLQQLVSGSNPFSPPDVTFTVQSSLIEDDPFALELAQFWLDQVNREIVTGSLSTWRDDVMGPAQSHLVDALDRLGAGEKLWVTGLTLEVNEKGELTQTPTYLGGGFEANYSPVPV